MNIAQIVCAVISTVFMLVYNALFYLLGGVEHPASVWMAYGILHGAYVFLILTPLFVKKDKNTLTNMMPLTLASVAHFLVQLLACTIVILIAPDGYTAFLVVEIILVAVFFIAFFSILAVNIHTTTSATRQQDEIYYIRNQASRIKLLMGRHMGGKLDRKLEKVYDNLFACPTHSNANTEELESEISRRIGELERAMREERAEDAVALMDDILLMLENMNRIVRNHQ